MLKAFNNKTFAIYNSDPNQISYEQAHMELEDIEKSIDQVADNYEIKYQKTSGSLSFESNC